MKRPIVMIAIGYVIGIIEGLYLHFSVVSFCILIATIYGIHIRIPHKTNPIVWAHFGYIRYLKRYINKKMIFMFIIAAMMGSMTIQHQEKQYIHIQDKLQKQGTIQTTGMITSNPVKGEYSTRYQFKVAPKRYFYIKVKNTEPQLKYGQAIKISGQFELPETSRNYGGFDNRQYLKTKQTIGTIQVETIQKIQQKQNMVEFFNQKANQISCYLKEKIQEVFPEKHIAGILIALLLGDTDFIPEDMMQDFRTANIAHVLAISGMHVSYLITLCMLMKKCIGKRKTYILTNFILVGYALITGFSPSIVRAVIMAILAMIAKIIYARSDTLNNIAISALLILLWNPYTILDIGFQLSFGGTLGIVLFQDTIKSKMPSIIAITLSAQIVVLPISIFHFNTISPYFLFTNLLVGLMMGPVMICSFGWAILLCIYPQFATTVAIIPKIAIQLLIAISKVTQLPFATIYVSTPRPWQFALYFFSIIFGSILYKCYASSKKNAIKKRLQNMIQMYRFYLKYRIQEKSKKIGKIIGIGLILVCLLLSRNPEDMKIHFVDVGQGDCTFIETPEGNTILIDGGGSETYDIGKNTVLPYILDRGYTKIDIIMISHFDTDHIGGILKILETLKVGQVMITKQGETSENTAKFFHIIHQKNIPVKVVQKGDRIMIEKNLYVDILWPTQSLIQENILNNNAMVARLKYHNFTMLLTGDIEEEAEQMLVSNNKTNNLLQSTVLKVGHHGSKSSSTEEFLECIQPKVAFIGVGKDNKYGHPHQEVLERLQTIRSPNL